MLAIILMMAGALAILPIARGSVSDRCAACGFCRRTIQVLMRRPCRIR
ncbi:hypothetical protein ACVXHA_10420 [Escherichia coli]